MTVEKNIPIPKSNVGRPFSYPFNEMEIGDSFWMATYPSKVMAAAGRIKDRKFTSRKEVKEKVHGVRVWRIK